MNIDEVSTEFMAGEGFDQNARPVPAKADEISAAYCLRFLRGLRDVAFATTDENGLPAVRIIDVMMVSVDPERLYFMTPMGKAFHDDVMRTRFVSLVGQSADYRTCRLRGHVEHPDDPAEQHRLVETVFALNPLMSELYPADAHRYHDVFFIENGEGEYFDLGQQPLLRASFVLGGGVSTTGHPLGQRFVISDRCQACGVCAAACPEKCIEPGDIYRIEQSHCLRCGICYDKCPFDAIDKL